MKLGEIIKQYRYIERISIRDMAADIEISASTLSRIERGENPDGKTLAKIIIWLLQ